MDEKEFLQRMEQIDSELSSDDVPVCSRVFRAFPLLAPNYHGPWGGAGIDTDDYPPYVGPNLLEKISNWYKERYAEKVYLPIDRGKVPIIIRRLIYFLRMPIAYGNLRIPVLPLIEGMTDDFKKSLKRNELELIRSAFAEGFNLTYEFEDLLNFIKQKKGRSITNDVVELIHNAHEDRKTAIKCLTDPIDTNAAYFHAQQNAEKCLKCVLLNEKKFSLEQLKKQFGHALIKLLNECVKLSENFSCIKTDVEKLSEYSVNIRYQAERISIEKAVEAFRAALRISGLSACQITGSKKR